MIMSNSNENESLPNIINQLIKKSSFSSSLINSSYVKNSNLNDVSSDCDSIISYRNDRSPDTKAHFDKVYKTKLGDARSILSIAKDLNSNIQVFLFSIVFYFLIYLNSFSIKVRFMIYCYMLNVLCKLI